MQETLTLKPNEKLKENITNLQKRGYTHVCLSCNTVYKGIPTSPYADGHNGRDLNMCTCGCDLFSSLEEVKNTCVIPVNTPIEVKGVKTNVLKEHNFKYCQCIIDGCKKEVHCGYAEAECGALLLDYLEEIERGSDRVWFKCLQSGYNIVILKDTEDEVNKRKQEYFICPSIKW